MVPKKMITDCSDCMLAKDCIPSGLELKHLHHFIGIVSTNIKYKTGEQLFQQDAQLPHLYVVKAGTFKTHIMTDRAYEHVNNFYLPGDIIGLDSTAGRIARSTATALENSMACKIDYRQLALLSREFPSLSDLAVKLYVNTLATANEIQNNLTIQCASSRLAVFILNYNKRVKKHTLQRTDISLSMSRQDIASHLGLAVETISRSFSKLIDTGCITKDNHHIQIVDLKKLQLEANLPPRQTANK
ncbi:MAG: CarD family transcriptional regulator [Piscirickettsiaceae bacterium]|nr:MAG: CarD family transcriptional regulator [Piscirickettsiaceae bacterium]